MKVVRWRTTIWGDTEATEEDILPKGISMFTLYVGRFQPFHLGHMQTIVDALEQSEEIILGLGSVSETRTQKNPFLYEERVRMIRASFSEDFNKRIHTIPLYDHVNDTPGWAQQVRDKVKAIAKEKPVAITGFNRDASSFYLDLFPEWKKIGGKEYGKINATEIRNAIFNMSPEFERILSNSVHPGAANVIREVIADDFFLKE